MSAAEMVAYWKTRVAFGVVWRQAGPRESFRLGLRGILSYTHYPTEDSRCKINEGIEDTVETSRLPTIGLSGGVLGYRDTRKQRWRATPAARGDSEAPRASAVGVLGDT